jgi:hypothetical protein
MKPFISTTFHGFADYIFSILLFTSPWTMGFISVGGGALFVPLFFGWVTLIMAFLTDYKASPIRQFPLQMHLILDMFVGFFIMVSPFLYDFSSKVFLPHLLFGLYLFVQAIFTKHSPFTTPTHHSVADGQLNSTAESEGRLTV